MGFVGKRAVRVTGASAILALAGFLGHTSAEALSPPPPLEAQVVYANGGRIMSMDADGSDRQVLIGSDRAPTSGYGGYTNPRLSPDGTRLAFSSRARRNRQGPSVFAARADGTGIRVLLKGGPGVHYLDPSWMPDGQTVIAGNVNGRKKPFSAGIVSIGIDGSSRKDLLRQKPGKLPPRLTDPLEIIHPVSSPDGSKILYATAEWPVYDDEGTFPHRMKVLNLATGKSRILSEDSSGGSWSPDGTRIVHSKLKPGREEICSIQGCGGPGSALYLIGADGKDEIRLTEGNADEISPDWSPDGTRIVFQSNRNVPESAEAYEIFSVRPDGGCLTWLTNGTPASTSPAWSPLGGYTEPGGCGSRGLEPDLGLLPPKTAGGISAPRLWLGQDVGGHLYTGEGREGQFRFLNYTDCAKYAPRACSVGFFTYEYSTCSLRGQLVASLGTGDVELRKGRGVPFTTSRGDGSKQTFVITGDRIIGGIWDQSDPTMSPAKFVAAVTPINGPATGKLASPRFPAREVKLMRKVARSFKDTGSVEKTATRLGMKLRRVKLNLAAARVLRPFGPFGAVSCLRRGVFTDSGRSTALKRP